MQMFLTILKPLRIGRIWNDQGNLWHFWIQHKDQPNFVIYKYFVYIRVIFLPTAIKLSHTMNLNFLKMWTLFKMFKYNQVLLNGFLLVKTLLCCLIKYSCSDHYVSFWLNIFMTNTKIWFSYYTPQPESKHISSKTRFHHLANKQCVVSKTVKLTNECGVCSDGSTGQPFSCPLSSDLPSSGDTTVLKLG